MARIARYIAYSVGAALLAWGQIQLARNHLSVGGIFSGAGALVLFLSYLAGNLDWKAMRQQWSQWRARVPELPSQTHASDKERAAPPPLESKPHLVNVLMQRFFPNDEIALSRHWFALPLTAAVVGMQAMILQGAVVQAVFILALAAVFGSLYLQNLGHALILPRLRYNLKTLALLLLGMPVQVGGFLLIRQNKFIWVGFAICVAASLYMIWLLIRRPFKLELDENSETPPLQMPIPQIWWTPNRIAIKAGLITAAVFFAYMAEYALSSQTRGLQVMLGFLASFLIIGTAPWFPGGIPRIKALPKVLRGALGLLLAGLAFWMGVKAQGLIEHGNVNQGLLWFLAGGIALVIGLSRFSKYSSSSITVLGAQDKTASSLFMGPGVSRGVEMFFFFALILTVFWMYFGNLEYFPYGAEGDEAGGGMWANDVLKGAVEHPLIHRNYPLAFFSVTALFFKFFGISLATMRWHSVFFGTVSVAATYFFMRQLWGRWVAWIAAGMMAFSFWHIHYSRFGHYNIEQVAYQMISFYWVFKGLKTGRVLHWALGGVALGLAMLPHMASRLIPIQGLLLVLFFLLSRRELFRRHFSGFIVLILASWMMASTAVTYWGRATHASMGRAKSVSIFDKNNSNAPTDTMEGFIRNVKVSFMMFNQMGDSRHRDNPLAPQKILEHWTAIVFALAFCFLVYHWRDPVAFFLLAVFLINLSASIFSVEAPQTLRTAGNISIVFSIIAYLLYGVLGAFRDLAGKKAGNLLFGLVIIPMALFMNQASWKKYFVEARNIAFDVAPTYVGMAASEDGDKDSQAVFWATGFASSHPPVVLFTEDTPIRNFYSLTEYMPVIDNGKKHILFLVDAYQSLAPYFESLYPKAKKRIIYNLRGIQDVPAYLEKMKKNPDTPRVKDIAVEYVVTRKDIQASNSLAAKIYTAGKIRLAEKLPLRWPSPGIAAATKIVWQGSMRAEKHGLYSFKPSGKGDCEIFARGQRAYRRMGGKEEITEVVLPLGQVPLKIVYSPLKGDVFKVHLEGRQPKRPGFHALRRRVSMELDEGRLFHVPMRGLYGRYYVTKDWKGPVVTQTVEPTLLANWLDPPLGGNYSGIFTADLKIDEAGLYRFSGNAVYIEVRVDGKLVYRQGKAPLYELTKEKVEPGIQLAAGRHRLIVRTSTHGPPVMQLRWTRPGTRSKEIILPRYLEPRFE